MFEQGFNVPEVAKLSLHRNPTLLLKTYTALRAEDLHLGQQRNEHTRMIAKRRKDVLPAWLRMNCLAGLHLSWALWQVLHWQRLTPCQQAALSHAETPCFPAFLQYQPFPASTANSTRAVEGFFDRGPALAVAWACPCSLFSPYR